MNRHIAKIKAYKITYGRGWRFKYIAHKAIDMIKPEEYKKSVIHMIGIGDIDVRKNQCV